MKQIALCFIGILHQVDVSIWLSRDEIVITGNDQDGIIAFQIKELGRLKYFLGIEVAQSRSGIVIF